MNYRDRKILAVIGAGPKGIAVAVKAKVLHEMGLSVDKVVLIEKHSVGAHWSGEAGFTDGEMRLGTSPEKDVVFPLETEVGDPVLDKKIIQRLMDFTWSSYLVETKKYSDWVDRGRPAPRHMEWSSYLKWVSERLAPEVSIIKANVECVDITESRQWSLKLKTHSGSSILEVDRLMLTGPGKTKQDFGSHHVPGTYNLESFWKAYKEGTFKRLGKIAIVGAGENAASVLINLSKLPGTHEIEVISPRGFISTRAENYHENQFYSRPIQKGWNKLLLRDRMDFIRRTDLGVFSVEAMQVLNGEVNHQIIPGRLIDLKSHDQKISLTLDYAGEKSARSYDQVILATGFDLAASLKSFLTESAAQKIEGMLGSKLSNENLSERILEDLSVDGVSPSLHLPMLAGLMQGPGFANLSCLGLLSDRVMLASKLMNQTFLQVPLEA